MSSKPSTGPLGEQTTYPATYTPSVLHAMDRSISRARSGISNAEAMFGEDLWNGYELSWLDLQGKPQVAGLRLRVPCQSAAIVESKSLKLYLNSFSMTRFENRAAVLRTLDQDLTLAFRSAVTLELLELHQLISPVQQLPGVCLDEVDVQTDIYQRDPDLLSLDQDGATDLVVQESLHSHLFRSLCPVTGQPDWASILIEYRGQPIARDALLRYLISYRSHQAFHENTIEQIYQDIAQICVPEKLSVYGYFQRRGGLDINPVRSSHEASVAVAIARLPRQ